jgi:hypothetical protein
VILRRATSNDVEAMTALGVAWAEKAPLSRLLPLRPLAARAADMRRAMLWAIGDELGHACVAELADGRIVGMVVGELTPVPWEASLKIAKQWMIATVPDADVLGNGTNRVYGELHRWWITNMAELAAVEVPRPVPQDGAPDSMASSLQVVGFQPLYTYWARAQATGRAQREG